MNESKRIRYRIPMGLLPLAIAGAFGCGAELDPASNAASVRKSVTSEDALGDFRGWIGPDAMRDAGLCVFHEGALEASHLQIGTLQSTVSQASAFTCSVWPFSSVENSGGWRIFSPGRSVPTVVTESGPVAGIFLDNLRLEFTYVGSAPRTGRAVALIPASARNDGGPASSESDALAGKRISLTNTLYGRVSYDSDDVGLALVDTSGRWSNTLPIGRYRSSYCRYGCTFRIPVADLVYLRTIDTENIRYIALVVEGETPGAPVLRLANVAFYTDRY